MAVTNQRPMRTILARAGRAIGMVAEVIYFLLWVLAKIISGGH